MQRLLPVETPHAMCASRHAADILTAAGCSDCLHVAESWLDHAECVSPRPRQEAGTDRAVKLEFAYKNAATPNLCEQRDCVAAASPRPAHGGGLTGHWRATVETLVQNCVRVGVETSSQ